MGSTLSSLRLPVRGHRKKPDQHISRQPTFDYSFVDPDPPFSYIANLRLINFSSAPFLRSVTPKLQFHF